ncbi:Trk2 protein [Martiniozyma asiatica (nom. inval.)]|nr:Trk2 protein [Martiniozyma asiatica]
MSAEGHGSSSEDVPRPIYSVIPGYESDAVEDVPAVEFENLQVPNRPTSSSANKKRRASMRDSFGSTMRRTGSKFDEYQFIFKETIGYRIRQIIYKIEDAVGPIIKKIVPNFIIAHYVYICLFIIFGSILIYPVKNISYVDALFLAAGGSTQAGLNTINLNDISLYQQIVIYIITMFTTPIFIHSSLVFLRLYWYEKRFDNIKDQSVKQFKMRRTMTLANLRSNTTISRSGTLSRRDSTKINGMDNLRRRFFNKNAQDLGENSENDIEMDGYSFNNNNNNNNNISNNHHYSPESISKSELHNSDSDYSNRSNKVLHSSSSDDTAHDDTVVHNVNGNDNGNNNDNESHTHISNGNVIENQNIEKINPLTGVPSSEKSTVEHANIKFASNLPKPKKKNKREIDPRDLVMSISVLQHQNSSTNDGEEGPALRIKPPIEQEQNNNGEYQPPIRHHRKLMKERKRLKALAKQQKLEQDLLINTNLSAPQRPEFGRSLSVPVSHTDSFHIRMPHFNFSVDDYSKIPKDKNNNNFAEKDPLDGDEPQFDHSKNKNLLHPTKTIDNIIKKGRKRASLFTRTLTGRHNPDDDLISEFSDQLENHYLSFTPTVGRNSNFVTFNDEQKIELGGVEYQAMKLLSWILICYYVGFHIIGAVFLLPFILHKQNYGDIMRSFGVGPTWWAFFTSASVFNDLGYTLNPNSMIPFAQNAYVLIISSFFIVIGNTGFPVFLRFLIWLLKNFSRPLTMFNNSLNFLLDHPRRCFTLLFPSQPTWWLFFVLFVMNSIDWILFIILDFHSKSLAYLPGGYRVLDGLFQAFSTRTAGFAVVDLSLLNPAIKVSYMVMMYISVFPLAISIRRTNVYEEQSLGVYGNGNAGDDDDSPGSKRHVKFIGTHLRKQLSFDLWFLFLAVFIVCICEASKIESGNFNIFDVMFELTSAYGTVGLSMGYPNTNTSFSAQFSTLSKLVTIATMIRGRHRGLPNSIDRAILLSDNKLNLRDDLEAYNTLMRANTSRSVRTNANETDDDDDENNDRNNAATNRFGMKVLKLLGKVGRNFLFSDSSDQELPRNFTNRTRTNISMDN